MSIRTKVGSVIGRARNAVAADQARKSEVERQVARSIALTVVCSLALTPGLALAAGMPWDSVATNILNIFNGGLTRTIAILAVISCGIAAIAGKLSWDWAIKIIIGVIFIFGGAAIVDYLIAAAS